MVGDERRLPAAIELIARGRPLPLVRVEQDFLGCRVDQTVHRVELRFRPRSFVRGTIASAVGGVLLIVAVAIGFRPRPDQSRAR